MKEPKTSALSCDQLCPITADRMSYTVIIKALIISALMISIAQSVPPVSAHQCHINATYQCLPLHINATYQCPSELPFIATYQCQSVPPISASLCHLSVPINAIYQCLSVLL
ncbi:unnamed protein product, partial [Staurois parvus]